MADTEAALRAHLRQGRQAIVVAPPGTGKTTRLPPALLGEGWAAAGRILVLEPRRVAARAAAAFVAAGRGEAVGDSIGHAVRFDRRAGPATRIEYVTEGVLTRRLLADPELSGIAALVFDEVHERNLEGDLALALALEVQAGLRPDLRLVAMSATPDIDALRRAMPAAAIVALEAPGHPVEIRHQPPREGERLAEAVARAVAGAVAAEPGDLLAFLPGRGEIRAVAALLAGRLPAGVRVLELHGGVPAREQDRALRRDPGEGGRRVVLATNLAESSVTVDGVRLVVDSGRMRVPVMDRAVGLSRLVTVPVTRANATQRAGRAGRQGPGICWRLWPREAHGALAPHPEPEIRQADLAGLALSLADWGLAGAALADPAALPWMEPPPAQALAAAIDLLRALGALDGAGRITPTGRKMAALPLHPRLARVLLAGREAGAPAAALAARAVALLAEGGAEGEPDLAQRLQALERPGGDAGLGRARDLAARLLRMGERQPAKGAVPIGLAALLAAGFPDRVALALGAGRFKLRNGRQAVLPAAHPLAGAEALVVAEAGGAREGLRIDTAAALTRAELERLFADAIVTEEELSWSPAAGLSAQAVRRLDGLELGRQPLPRAVPEKVAGAVLAFLRAEGVQALPWSGAAAQMRGRLALAARSAPAETWPRLDDPSVQERLAAALAGAAGVRGAPAPAALEGALATALADLLDWPARQALARLAPAALRLANGLERALDYGEVGNYGGAEGPVLRLRLQDLFGVAATPELPGGRAVQLDILSPAGRSLQRTADLAGFWAGSYAQVRKEMRGRYPKHPWPEDPAAAPLPQRRRLR